MKLYFKFAFFKYNKSSYENLFFDIMKVLLN